MSDIYHDGSRQLQDEFDTRRLADRLDEAIVQDSILPSDREFIERLDMFFIATVDERGQVNCSYKAGEPGFVRVLDEHTLAFPSYDGNGMYLSMGNILRTRQVGMLFIDFENQKRMRLNGEATLHRDDPLMAEYPEAQFIVRVRAREVFANCPRYIHKMKLVQRSRFVPQQDCPTPVPGWKKGEWVADALPADDPAHDKSREIIDR
ncbi:pyridoxamine 5'-phosphate oxidase [Sulfuricaulis limicola]|uniref:Pyridoxamine 5'-phosphate oxidase n=1 Tax=Sulfuricaulis limicola TaxID=1620215 RepID=A0A1B4XFL0_9GAMM|nr:pyridoxamine 5'-phosphate oxidase family protein [Sulfuricaulis limicola]BAV33595.1 pyridoxamine 5'-phosphate oxidase [Sulfuricaulis limicola]